MGNYIKILAVVIVLVFAGCKDWLDVTPAGQATESDLFSKIGRASCRERV